MPALYYLPAAVNNPLVRFKYRCIDWRRPMPAAPRHVQIQTVSGCNANCVFCPNKKTELDIPMGRRMDWGLYRSIVDQCVELGVPRFSPYLMNEPMLDPEIPERIAYISKRKKSWQFTKINSHGGLLTERMAQGLLDSGLNKLHFSVQGLDPDVYWRIMRLKLDKTLRNIERFLELKEQGNYKLPKVKVLMLDTSEIHGHLSRIRQYWKSLGVRVKINQIENRANHCGIQANEIAVRDLQPFDWCCRLFNQIYVLYDGRLVQCCADWEQSSIMGDLSKEPLYAIWHGPRYMKLRQKFLDGQIAGMLCDGCSKDAVGS
jgi:MoaA/NifB/PqqE/SkfB family radical SAM enzyme